MLSESADNNIGFHMPRNSQSIIFQLSKSKFPVLYYVKSNRRKNIFCHQIDELYVTKIGVFIIKHWLVTAGPAVTTKHRGGIYQFSESTIVIEPDEKLVNPTSVQSQDMNLLTSF